MGKLAVQIITLFMFVFDYFYKDKAVYYILFPIELAGRYPNTPRLKLTISSGPIFLLYC